ncbi:MAG TPA: L-2-hydroxyglutarate oxidase [Acidimicrobiales bacterium]|nr:L-2-hydroxyglutarate oxidase [Acidimicrobiales bacterium]
MPGELPRTADLVVVGAGIVGLAVAEAVTGRDPSATVVVVDKENRVAAHQSGRNSGVLHSGIYYEPRSMKALAAKAGREAMVRFCDDHDVAYEVCGKVVVAVDTSELAALAALEARGIENGLTVTRLDRRGLAEAEPHADGVGALHVAETGIVDFVGACRALAGLVEERGSSIVLGAEVTSMRTRDRGAIVVETTWGAVTARRVVNCGGLQSDRVAAMASADTSGVRIIPFRGEYFDVDPTRSYLCRNLIYPVPDPRFPFLGVHLTRSVHGGVHAGPNAVVALAREGYRRRDVRGRDAWELVANPGMRRLARRYWRVGAGEMYRSVNHRAFLKALQRLVPDIRLEDLHPAPAGVRAQALERSGELVDDFRFADRPGLVNVVNAPSPAATAALEIGRHVAERLANDGSAV